MPRVLFILQDLSHGLVSDEDIRNCLVAAEGSPALVPEDCDIQRVHAEKVAEADPGGCDLVLVDYRSLEDPGIPPIPRVMPTGVPVILLVAEHARCIVDDAIDCLEYAVVQHSSDFRGKLIEAVNRAAQRQVLHKIHLELTRARQVQSAMLPSSIPDIPGIDVSARSIPAGLVGGDFHEFMSPTDSVYDFLIGDVTGHGFNAAIRMAETQAYFRSFMGDTDCRLTPADVLQRVNRLMVVTCSEIPLFASAMIVRIDMNRRTIAWAGAGHQGYLLRARGETVVLAPRGPVLGCYPDAEFGPPTEFPLHANDRILLVTDGIPETSSDDSNELYGVDRMLAELNRCADTVCDDVLARLLISVREFRGFATPKDDITAVMIRAT